MKLLPDELFQTGNSERPMIAKKVNRVDIQRIITNDPTESVDSENLRGAIADIMPECKNRRFRTCYDTSSY